MARKHDRGGDPVRFAVIGQGYFAQSAVLPAFENADNCELRAIFSEDDTKLSALKRKYGVDAALGYQQYDDYLASGEVDAVYIALPNDLHCEYTMRAAEAHVHVLCEKPMGLNAEEAEWMIAACRDNGVKLMVGYRLHFEAANLEAVEQLNSGALGLPRFLSAAFAMQVQENNIRTKRERGGGPLLDLGIYCVNAARYLFRAEPTEVLAASATRKTDPRFDEVDEQVSALLRFPEDRLAQFTCSFGAYDHSSVTVVGERGRLTLDPAFDIATDLVLTTEIEGRKPKRKVFARRDQVAPELDEFACCIIEGREPEPSGQEGLDDLRVLDAISRSLDSGHKEPVQTIPRRQRPSLRQKREKPAHPMPPLIDVQPPGRR